MGPFLARSLAAQLRELDELSKWDELQALAERVALALRGEEALLPYDVARLQRWPVRWRMVSKHVRRFYRRILEANLTPSDRAAIYRGLIAILDGREPGDPARAQLSRLHREQLGDEAGIDLAPVQLSHHKPKRTTR